MAVAPFWCRRMMVWRTPCARFSAQRCWVRAGLEWRKRWGGLQEPLVGFEPTTARLRIESSTPELQWRDVGCPGADSNRDAFRHYPLKIACLPVSPPGRAGEQDSRRE